MRKLPHVSAACSPPSPPTHACMHAYGGLLLTIAPGRCIFVFSHSTTAGRKNMLDVIATIGRELNRAPALPERAERLPMCIWGCLRGPAIAISTTQDSTHSMLCTEAPCNETKKDSPDVGYRSTPTGHVPMAKQANGPAGSQGGSQATRGNDRKTRGRRRRRVGGREGGRNEGTEVVNSEAR